MGEANRWVGRLVGLTLAVGLLLLAGGGLVGCGKSGGDGSNAVKEDPGDDTYVPSFRAGNVSFTDVWVPDNVQTGYEVAIWFDVTADEAKHNVYVRLDLLELPYGNASDLEIDAANYSADYQLTGLVIEALEAGETRHIEHSFNLPAGVPDGTYAAVFTINAEDYFPEDDSLQAERSEDADDNFIVAPATLIVGTPDLPNLRILSTELNNSSFELSNLVPVEIDGGGELYLSQQPVLNLNMEVESMARHTTDPVDIVFDLEVDGVSYPLYFTRQDAEGNTLIADVWTYDVTCQDLPPAEADVEPSGYALLTEDNLETLGATEESTPTEEPTPVEVCASLFRQSQVGNTYDLRLSQEAYEALATKTEDTPCNLVIQVDPDGAIAEWTPPGKSDNSKEIPVLFLPPEEAESDVAAGRSAGRAAAYRTEGPYEKAVLDLTSDEMYGNDWFAAGYEVGPNISYQVSDWSGSVPTAGYAGALLQIKGKIFKADANFFKAWAKADVNIDNITGSGFDWGVALAATKIWGNEYSLAAYIENKREGEADPDATEEEMDSIDDDDPVEIWNTKDDDDKERFAKRTKLFKKSKTFIVYCIPITVEAGAQGELGVKGAVYVDSGNLVGLKFGPYAQITGYAEGGVNLAVARGGVGCSLTLIELANLADATMQLQPSVPLAVFRFQAPLTLESLSGNVYAYMKRLKYKSWWRFYWKKSTYPLISWSGFEKEWHWFDPLMWAVGSDYYEVSYWDNETLSGEPSLESTEGRIDHNWAHTTPGDDIPADHFSARWEGSFTFEQRTYEFTAVSDDGVRVWVDGHLIIDDWTPHAPRTYRVNRAMTAGEHAIKVEYFERTGGAVMKFGWAPAI